MADTDCDNTQPAKEERSVVLSFPSIRGYERIAMACCASYAQMAGYAKERVEGIKTAVAEACLNAIEHGNKGRLDAYVRVEMNYEDGVMDISVSDEGEGIQELPEELDAVAKENMLQEPGGLGLHLIDRFVDSVVYNQMTNESHTLKMMVRKRD